MKRVRIIGFASLLVCTMCLPQYNGLLAQAPQQNTRRGAARRAPEPPPKPLGKFRFDEVLRTVDDMVKGTAGIDLKFVMDQIWKRGIDFECTEKERALLIAGKAPEDILWVLHCPTVEEKRVPPTAGAVLITSDQPGSDVWINGRKLGTAGTGPYQITGLLAGEIAVEVRKEGFESQARVVKLEPQQPSRLAFSLKPSVASMEKRGSELLLKAVNSLGGTIGIAAQGRFAGTGALRLPKLAQDQTWKASVYTRLPDAVYLKLQAQGAECVVTTGLPDSGRCKGSKAQTDTLRKAGEIALRLLRDYQLPALLNEILTSNSRVIADSALPPGASERLRADTKDATFILELAPDGTPKAIARLSRDQSKPSVYVVYSNYIEFGGKAARGPQKIEIRSGQNQQPDFELVWQKIVSPPAEKVADIVKAL